MQTYLKNDQIHSQNKWGATCHQSSHELPHTFAVVGWLAQLAVQLAVWPGSSEHRGVMVFTLVAQELMTGAGQG